MKNFVRLLCLLMLTMLLCACGADTAPADTTSSVKDDVVRDVAKDFLAKEKQVVKLAALNIFDDWFPAVVTMFNLTNENYYVDVNYYVSRGYSFLDDYSVALDEAVTKLNIDITTGNIPDIVLLPEEMQTSSYISKGVFVDLNEFIDNDSDFDRADYLPSLFEAFDRNGKMYEITPMLSLNTIQGKTADVGTDISWTLDEFAAFIESEPEARYILGDMTSREFVIKMTQYLFVNPMTLEIKFDRDEFKKILAVAERFPADLPHDYRMFSIEYNEFMTGVKDGDPLMTTLPTWGFWVHSRFKKEYYGIGEEVTYKGWPSSADNGIRFSASEYFSILKSAQNSDGAWAFLKYALNHAKSAAHLPANLSLLEKAAEDALIDSKELTKEDIDETIALLKAASAIYKENTTISKIIDDEIGSYLSGQKPADTVIDIIENRIAIYLAEQQ